MGIIKGRKMMKVSENHHYIWFFLFNRSDIRIRKLCQKLLGYPFCYALHPGHFLSVDICGIKTERYEYLKK